MARVSVRKTLTAAAVAAIVGFGAAGMSLAHPSFAEPGYGMMGGYGIGPGMTQGYGAGYGMGPGMMYGYGAGYGMGPGMMYGYGPDSSWGCSGGYGLDLSKEQESKLASIQKQLARKQLDRMSTLQEEQFKLRDLYAVPQPDDKAITASRERLAKLQRDMYQAGLDARKQMDEVLTPEQRAQLSRGGFGARGR